ncbi:HD domain-containing protein [Actinomadura flavalba]|uniref:HD domain-containing protein n=1 Tax=Actinomadura flavalba TaxID=1120938 RepID=UPI0003739327|nr:HD domain-containing protein [Actinomadura flavalba]
MSDETVRLTGLIYELGLLKRYKRAGWHVAGVAVPESIADHSFRAAVIAAVLAAMEGASPERAALLSLFHDSQETRLTDLPLLAKPYVTRAPNTEVTARQTRGLPPAVAALIGGVVGEYEARESPEALCARDADKLECLFQALEYGHQGNPATGPWVDSNRALLRTASALRLADAAVATDFLDWVKAAVDDER